MANVECELEVREGKVLVRFKTEGVRDLEIEVGPQIAFDWGRSLIKAAENAHKGKSSLILPGELLDDKLERARAQAIQRVALMLNSTRENKTYSNRRLAQVVVDAVGAKIK